MTKRLLAVTARMGMYGAFVVPCCPVGVHIAVNLGVI
jgi:hypothetical protein